MSARYVAVPSQYRDEIRTLGGIGNLSCRVYWGARGATAEDALEAQGDDAATVYDLETGEEVEW